MVERTRAPGRTSALKQVQPEVSRSRGTPSRRSAADPAEARYRNDRLANSAVLQLLRSEAGGRPLDPAVRAAMELRLRADLSRVRVHTGPRAAASADALSARAFTIGQDIAFGPGEYRPADSAGRCLLAHELMHTVQQARGETPVGIARQEKTGEGQAVGPVDDSLGTLGNAVVEVISHTAAGGGIQQRMLSAAVRGFIAELGRQVKTEEAVARLKSSLNELLVPQNLARFVGGYTAGAVAGLVSPVTDLLGIGQLAEQLPRIAANLLGRAYPQARRLAQEATELAEAIGKFSHEAPGKLIALLKEPSKIYELIEQCGPKAVDAAGGAGRQAARGIVGFFRAKKEKNEAPESVLHALTSFTHEEMSGVSSLLASKATRLRKAVISTPWADFGYTVGHAVGAVVSNLLLFIFSEGIGNAVSKIAAGLGEVAPLLAGKLAKAGEAITALEHAIGAMIGAATKLVKPLEEILGPLMRLMERLRGFLRRLLGLAETEAAELAARGATVVTERASGKTAAAATPAKRPLPAFPKAAAKAPPAPPKTTAGTAAVAESSATGTASTTASTAGTSAEAATATAKEAETTVERVPTPVTSAETATTTAPAVERAATPTGTGAAEGSGRLVHIRPPEGSPRLPVSAKTRQQQAALAGREPSVSPLRPPKAKPPPTTAPAVQPVPQAEAVEELVEETAVTKATGTENLTAGEVSGAAPGPTTAMTSGRGNGRGVKAPPTTPKTTTREPGGTVTPIRREQPPKAPVASEAQEVATHTSTARTAPAKTTPAQAQAEVVQAGERVEAQPHSGAPPRVKASVLPQYSSRSTFMEAMRKRLLAQRVSGKPSPLDFLLDPAGLWRKGSFVTRSGRTMRGRYALSDPDQAIVQAGHMQSDWYAKATSRRDYLMLEDADLNWMTGSAEAGGSVTSKPAVLIDGVPVDIPTARLWESHGALPPGTVSGSPIVDAPDF
ncbi:polymorphic toxin type 5 domain-containing protein [Streptomyces sp. NPDC052109]|uniref:polymorphic toxin type 5 domain-containing protein n=1 Tax=Streptomyces sp. NPDC052109 TaxID=3155527 RepID=UPI0034468336